MIELTATQQYIRDHGSRFIDELFELLRIPSISAESAHADDMQRAAQWLRESLMRAGADCAEVMPTSGNPVVYAEKMVDPSAPTILVYAHYDVMPVDPIDQWTTPPFEPEIREGRIWARGANDDKGLSAIRIPRLILFCA